MKNRTLILLFVLATIFVGCNNDDDSRDSFGLEGEWNLIHLGGGIVGFDIDIDPGLIIWTFENGSIEIVHNSSLEIPFLKPPGIFSYTVLHANNTNYLVIEGVEKGEIIRTGNTFSVNQDEQSTGSGNDGFGWLFKR